MKQLFKIAITADRVTRLLYLPNCNEIREIYTLVCLYRKQFYAVNKYKYINHLRR